MSGVGVVGELWRYPVKSFLGERLERVSLDARGLEGDRAFAVCDANGKLGSGKTTRRFRLLRDLFDFAAQTDDGDVVVHAPGGERFRAGDPELDALLSARYGEPLAVLPERTVPHFDVAPVHLLSTSSLSWAAAGYGATGGEARRYRPNIVLDTDGTGLVEEGWVGTTLSVGSCVLRISERAERCVMPTFRQAELERTPGLLRFLVQRNDTMLGVYAEIVTPGTVSVGDPVRRLAAPRPSRRTAW